MLEDLRPAPVIALPLLALSLMTAVAPQNEESRDEGIAAKVLIVAGSAATGAVVGAALAGGTSFVAFSGACAQGCVDNPQLVVTPLAVAAGGAVGAIGGALLGIVLATTLDDATSPGGHADEPAAVVEDFPDE